MQIESFLEPCRYYNTRLAQWTTSDGDSILQGSDADLNSQASISDNDSAMEQWLPGVDQDEGSLTLHNTSRFNIYQSKHTFAHILECIKFVSDLVCNN